MRNMEKIITKAFNRRSQGDYDSYIEFDLDTVKEMFDDMKEFNRKIEDFIKTN